MPRYKAYDHISIREQAKQAAYFYLDRPPRPIHVFPCKRTGHAVEFRDCLAALIARGFTGDRESNEERCAELGYPFVEVDLDDYVGPITINRQET